MTKEQAIAVRSAQLGGQVMDPVVLAQAMEVIRQPDPAKPKRKYRPRGQTAQNKPTTPRATGLAGAKERANRVLIKNLSAAHLSRGTAT